MKVTYLSLRPVMYTGCFCDTNRKEVILGEVTKYFSHHLVQQVSISFF